MDAEPLHYLVVITGASIPTSVSDEMEPPNLTFRFIPTMFNEETHEFEYPEHLYKHHGFYFYDEESMFDVMSLFTSRFGRSEGIVKLKTKMGLSKEEIRVWTPEGLTFTSEHPRLVLLWRPEETLREISKMMERLEMQRVHSSALRSKTSQLLSGMRKGLDESDLLADLGDMRLSSLSTGGAAPSEMSISSSLVSPTSTTPTLSHFEGKTSLSRLSEELTRTPRSEMLSRELSRLKHLPQGAGFDEFSEILQRIGFETLSRGHTTGSHQKFTLRTKNLSGIGQGDYRISVPTHRSFKKGTLHGILSQVFEATSRSVDEDLLVASQMLHSL